MPMGLHAAIQHIKFETPALAPMADAPLCLRDEDGCSPGMMFRGGPVRPADERQDDLEAVNATVDQAIAPERNESGLAGEKWLINPDS
jgi:predicted transglutaminase-like cysteine proteinase